VSCHIGSIETLVAAFATRGMPVYGLADDTAYPELYELLQAQRRRWGVEVVPWRNLRSLFRILRDPVVLGLLVDWGYRAEDVPVRLFGAWTTLPAGPAVLAARTGALLVPVACRRRPDGRYEAQHLDPIEVTDGSPAGVARATQAIATAVEAMVRVAPAQWYTFKRMWPPTEAEALILAERARESLGEAGPA
jgi:phosphatidylinositol dimannoside acyltransferase